MKNAELAKINFTEIINYGGQPKVQNSYSTPLSCIGYCVRCEESGLINKTGGQLELMSHGCDSFDFESILGAMPQKGVKISQPILFLLENPGANRRNGAPVDFRGFRKQPPVNHYYWTPNNDKWPDQVSQFNGNFYGPYFSYLMKKHQLGNVYISNLIKCKWMKGNDSKVSNDSLLRSYCIEQYLKREIEVFAPKIVFCFGRNAEKGYRAMAFGDGKSVYLMHPSFIADRHQTTARSQEDLVKENDGIITQAIEQIDNKGIGVTS
ncbi:MAG: hypothetical protein PF503_00305 [Desulfobacula sp.]|nr:hypothetical protein [Desulfobacula sp.]